MFPLLVLIKQQEIIEQQRKHQAELEAKFEAQLKHQADQHQAELEVKLKELEGKFQGCIVG
jgi:hypothetical protein